MRISHQAAAFVAALSGALFASTATQADQQAFQRACNGTGGEHSYTTSVVEIANAALLGYSHEGGVCDLVTGNDARVAAPLYRAFSPSQVDHFNAIMNLGYQYEGISGYLVNTGAGFYQAYSVLQGDHFYTKSVAGWFNAVSPGDTLESPAGQVL